MCTRSSDCSTYVQYIVHSTLSIRKLLQHVCTFVGCGFVAGEKKTHTGNNIHVRDHNHHLLIRNEKLHAFMVAATFNLTKQWIIAFEISHVFVYLCVRVCVSKMKLKEK